MENNLKNYLGHLIQLKLRGKQEKFRGVLKAFSNDWLLLNYNPVDYVLDGYILVNNRHVIKIVRTDDEEFIEAVLKESKIQQLDQKKDIDIENSLSLFEDLSLNYSAVQIELGDDSVVYLGKVSKVNKSSFRMRLLSPKGGWVNEESFIYSSIRVIQIEGDYLQSLIKYINSNYVKNPIR